MNEKLLAPLSRRKLIAAAGIALAGTAATGAPAFALAPAKSGGGRAPLRPLAHAGIDAWSQQVGSSFRVRTEAGVRTLNLVEVRPLGKLGRGGARRDRAFAAVFAAPDGGVLPQGGRIYPAAHASGSLDIFFGPAGDTLVAIFA